MKLIYLKTSRCLLPVMDAVLQSGVTALWAGSRLKEMRTSLGLPYSAFLPV
jgi:hypothetical protein